MNDIAQRFAQMDREEIAAWNARQLNTITERMFKSAPRRPAETTRQPRQEPIRRPRLGTRLNPATRAADTFIQAERAAGRPRPKTRDIVAQFKVDPTWTRSCVRRYFGPAGHYKSGRDVEGAEIRREKVRVHLLTLNTRPSITKIVQEFHISRDAAAEMINRRFGAVR